MQIKSILLVGVVAALCGCQLSDTERGVIGAAGGAVAADATGIDPVVGAAVGGTAGVFCDNAGVCR